MPAEGQPKSTRLLRSDSCNTNTNFFIMGTYLVDKLKNIRPFSESQLLSLHQIPELEENEAFVDTFLQECILARETGFYSEVAKLKKWKYLLERTKAKISELAGTCEETQEKVWKLVSHTIQRKSHCNDGRLVEGKHIYNEAVLCPEVLRQLDQSSLNLYESIANDYCFNLFMAQHCAKLVQISIKEVIDMADPQSKRAQLKNLITCLFEFLRIEEAGNDFSSQCKQWLSKLISILLSNASNEDRLFVLNHVLRCSGGISTWAVGYVQCPNPTLDAEDGDTMSPLNHALTILYTILTPVAGREKFLGITETSPKHNANKSADDAWLLIDAETDESEEVFANRLHFTETDIISLLKQIPFHSIIKFVTGEGKCSEGSAAAESQHQQSEQFGEVSEVTMLKLLAMSTRIVQILKQGLNTFNCMRFKKLTDYVTALIRKTVRAVSRFWINCKERFRSDDQALVLRLQVEYDHFILRAVTTILESQRYGIWKFISVIPFNGVTEAMMWHILWVFYNNGRDETDELGGLCPYFSDSYWKAKFNEPAVKYLFHEKLQSLSAAECGSLLESMGNMAKSRTAAEKELINTLTTEIFEMTFVLQSKREGNMTKKCTEVFSELLGIHTFFVNAIIMKAKASSVRNDEGILDCFANIPLDTWIPEEETFNVLFEWLINSSLNRFYNRLSRIILSKINWGSSSKRRKSLFLPIECHRTMAVKLHMASKMHVFVEDTDEPFNLSIFSGFNGQTALTLAKGCHPKQFVEWCWRMLLSLRLHVFEQPDLTPEIAANPEKFAKIKGFDSLPNTQTETYLLPICNSLIRLNPFAIYIHLAMTRQGHLAQNFDANMEYITNMLSSNNFVQSLTLLSWFVPLNVEHTKSIVGNAKFVAAFNNLVLCDSNELLDRTLGMIKMQLETHCANKIALLAFWIKLFYEVASAVIKQWSASWFLASSKGLQQVVYILDSLIELTCEDELLHQFLIKFFHNKPYDEVFAKQIASSSMFSWLPWGTSSNSNKKCEWIRPMHVLKQKFPEKMWLGWLVVKTDMLKMDKLWEEIVTEMNFNIDLQHEVAVKNVCVKANTSPIPPAVLPINAWAQLIADAPLDCPLLPILCYNFFLCFFTNSASAGSVGLRVVKGNTLRVLKSKINALIEHHHNLWSGALEPALKFHHSENTKLYRAYLTWLEDSHLHDAFVDVIHLPPQYCTEILKKVMDASSEVVMRSYVHKEKLQEHEEYFSRLWLDVKELDTNGVSLTVTFDVADDDKDASQACDQGKLDVSDTFVAANFQLVDPGSLLPLLQRNIKVVLDETRYFENRINKFEELNKKFFKDIGVLYENKKKEITLRITCDRDGYDPDGCTGAASLVFEYLEATQSAQVSKDMDRNRADFNAVFMELMDVPSDNLVNAIIHTEKCLESLSRSESNSDRNVQSDLLGYFLSAIADRNYVIYPPTKHLFTVLMETISFENKNLRDKNSAFLLQTALRYPNLIEYFAPRLVPSACSPECFFEMYKHVQENLGSSPAQIVFVLLSKFDVSTWLRAVSDDNTHNFLDTLGCALKAIGREPSDETMLVFGLYRKHLQYTAISRFPQYLKPVTDMLLHGMNNFSFSPMLWNDLLLSFGLFIKLGLPVNDIMLEMKKYANNQPLFNSSDLYTLLTTLSAHFWQVKQSQSRLELLEYFREYVRNFIIVLASLSCMWTNINSRSLAGNLENVWKPLFDAWQPWILPTELNQGSIITELEFAWDMFSPVLQYFTECFFGLTSGILSLVWQALVQYLVSTQNVVPENVELIQAKLKILSWNRFVPSESDIDLMYNVAFNGHASPSEMLTHIVMSVNWTHAMQYINNKDLPESMEKLSYVLVSIVRSEQALPIHEIPLHVVETSKTSAICQSITRTFLLETYFKNKSVTSNSLLLTMLKSICAIETDQQDNFPKEPRDLFAKQKIFVESITRIMTDAVKSDPEFLTLYMVQLQQFFKEALDDLTFGTVQGDEGSESNSRRAIFSVIFELMNIFSDAETAVDVATPLVAKISATSNAKLVEDCVCAACQTLQSAHVASKLIEEFIFIYASNEGPLISLAEGFVVEKSLKIDEFVQCCIKNCSALSLFVLLFHSKPNSNHMQITCDTMEASCQLKPFPQVEAKVILLWHSVLLESIALLNSDPETEPLIISTMKTCRQLVLVADEVVSPGFMSFMKFGKKSISNRTAFLTLTMAALGLKRLTEVTTVESLQFTEINALTKLISNKIQSTRKNKAYAEWFPLIDQVIEHINAQESLATEGMTFLRTWLLAFYADLPFSKFMLMMK